LTLVKIKVWRKRMLTKTRINLANSTTFLVLGMVLGSLDAPRAAAQQAKTPQDVHVVNAAADPVPVKIDGTTNTVKIDGTTNTVKATQTGAWSVGISGTPSVTLSGSPTVTLAPGAAVQIGNPASSPAIVRNVDRPTAQPFRTTLFSTFNAGFAASTSAGPFVVPGGKRLVIEFVTVNITLPAQQQAQFARLDTTGSFNQYLSLTPAGNDATGKPVFIGTHRIFVILEPGTSMDAFGVRNSGTDFGVLIMTLSGYLVDI
jgi:hypothetical protein